MKSVLARQKTWYKRSLPTKKWQIVDQEVYPKCRELGEEVQRQIQQQENGWDFLD